MKAIKNVLEEQLAGCRGQDAATTALTIALAGSDVHGTVRRLAPRVSVASHPTMSGTTESIEQERGLQYTRQLLFSTPRAALRCPAQLTRERSSYRAQAARYSFPAGAKRPQPVSRQAVRGRRLYIVFLLMCTD